MSLHTSTVINQAVSTLLCLLLVTAKAQLDQGPPGPGTNWGLRKSSVSRAKRDTFLKWVGNHVMTMQMSQKLHYLCVTQTI